jgi:hypothetical protein
MCSSGWRVDEPSRPKQQGRASGSRQKRSPGVYRADRQGLAREQRRRQLTHQLSHSTSHLRNGRVYFCKHGAASAYCSRRSGARLHNGRNARGFRPLDAAEAETVWAAPNSCERFIWASLALGLGRLDAARSERAIVYQSDRRACTSLDLDCSEGEARAVSLHVVDRDIFRVSGLHSSTLPTLLRTTNLGAPNDEGAIASPRCRQEVEA